MMDLTYDVVYSRRKTIALSLDADGSLTVRAPFYTSRTVIEDVILRHRKWIIAKQQQLAAAKTAYPAFNIADGAVLPYLGERLTLHMTENTEIMRSGNALFLEPQTSKAELTAWLKAQLRPILEECVDRFSRQMDVRPTGLTVTSAKTRWGSCSAADRLSFSFRLVFCPVDVIEYVVVHELAHIRYKNHGQRFWQQVAEVLPDYVIQREWLKQNVRVADILA